ncbi:MAG: hypothetical protein HFJ09_08640 [Lachnospiraceae bacterium]|nr:hypothetical protein [Lachnospiraceae bacterium]
MKENKGLVINVGTSSVVLILLVFALSVFALLSIRASNSELQLAKRTGESVQEYYEADKTAEYVLCYIQQIVENSKIEDLEKNLQNINGSGQKELDNLQNIELVLNDNVIFTGNKNDKLGTIEYSIFIEEKKHLKVSLGLYGDRSFSIETWCMVKETEEIEELGSDIELWDGFVTTE